MCTILPNLIRRYETFPFLVFAHPRSMPLDLDVPRASKMNTAYQVPRCPFRQIRRTNGRHFHDPTIQRSSVRFDTNSTFNPDEPRSHRDDDGGGVNPNPKSIVVLVDPKVDESECIRPPMRLRASSTMTL